MYQKKKMQAKIKVIKDFWGIARGLRFRKPLKKGEAYLFDFNKMTNPKKVIFDMLGVKFAIVMVFIDEQGQETERLIALKVNPFYAPKFTYSATKPFRYVLEASAEDPTFINPINLKELMIYEK